jgi:nitrate reductase assembly molybdenum cofactor insertion protein NarJ
LSRPLLTQIYFNTVDYLSLFLSFLAQVPKSNSTVTNMLCI